MNFLGYFVLLTTLLVVAHSVDNQESYGDDSFLSNLDENDSNIDFSSLTDIDDNCTPGKNQAVNGLRRRQGRICYPPKNPVKNQQPSPPEGQQNPSSGGQQMEDPNVQSKDKQSQLENRRLCPYDIYGRFRQIPVCDSGVSATRIWEQDDKTWTLVNVHLFSLSMGCWAPRRRWCCGEFTKQPGDFVWYTANWCLPMVDGTVYDPFNPDGQPAQ